MRLSKILTAMMAVIAIGGAAFGPGAQAQVFANPAQNIPNFNIQSFVPVLQELGAQTEILSMGGNQTVGVKLPSGAKFLMTPTVCVGQPVACRGVSVAGLFRIGNATGASVNRFNQQGAIPKAVLDGTQVRLLHYMIADFGMPRGNFVSHIAVMENAIQRYSQFGHGPGGGSLAVSLGMQNKAHVGMATADQSKHGGGYASLRRAPRDYVNRPN